MARSRCKIDGALDKHGRDHGRSPDVTSPVPRGFRRSGIVVPEQCVVAEKDHQHKGKPRQVKQERGTHRVARTGHGKADAKIGDQKSGKPGVSLSVEQSSVASTHAGEQAPCEHEVVGGGNGGDCQCRGYQCRPLKQDPAPRVVVPANEQDGGCKRQHLQRGQQQGVAQGRGMPRMGIPLRFGEE